MTGPVRTVPAAATAAMPFRSESFFDNRHVTIDIIDVFTFDDEGRITSMKAYFGPANIHSVEGM